MITITDNNMLEITRADMNRAWSALEAEKEQIDVESIVPSIDIAYHAKRLINVYVATLIGATPQSNCSSRYYQLDVQVEGMPLTIRVSDHIGYSDAGYKLAYGEDGQPERYIFSIIVNEDRSISKMAVEFRKASKTAHLILTNINSEYRLEEGLTYIDEYMSEFNDYPVKE